MTSKKKTTPTPIPTPLNRAERRRAAKVPEPQVLMKLGLTQRIGLAQARNQLGQAEQNLAEAQAALTNAQAVVNEVFADLGLDPSKQYPTAEDGTIYEALP
jgi:outer membrane protein TolC